VLQISSEVIIPPANPIPMKLKERIIPISELDPMAAGCFPVSLTIREMVLATELPAFE
jgi:antiviral helicase SLH1